MDFWVQRTQAWLNITFYGKRGWKEVPEHGFTGTETMEGLIRAFQINNGLPVTGNVGPMTIAKFKSLRPISIMNPNGPSDLNVFILQGALFCKGYNAGGLTGIYYNSGVAAIKQLQAHASIGSNGIIGWKEWSALLSMNWFMLVEDGDTTIRTIQCQLNSDFSNHIGVGPCDGIVSRRTALSLVAALQVTEGIDVNYDNHNINDAYFGESTKNLYSTIKMGDSYIDSRFVKIIQYGLYFNGFNPGRFDGVFDLTTQSCIKQFQSKHCLPVLVKGEVCLTTIMSLLTSRGNPDRNAYACDCATILNKQQAIDLKFAGYTHIGRYLTGTVDSGVNERDKSLNVKEISDIVNAGLSIVPIYQDGGYYEAYFYDSSQGTNDAKEAIIAALKVGLSSNTTIYFAVDFDCYGSQIQKYIIPYFKEINNVFNSAFNVKKYKVGIYAARSVCSKVYQEGLANTSYVCDMSTGFSGNLGFPIPENWAFDQFHELYFPSTPSFPLDKVAYSGVDKGCSSFDKPLDSEMIALIEAEKDSLNTSIGLFCEWERGKYKIFEAGLISIEKTIALQQQLFGDYMTVDFKVKNGVILANGNTFELGNLGLTKNEETTFYGYIAKFGNKKTRIKFTRGISSTKIEIETLTSVDVNGYIQQVSNLYSIIFRDPDWDIILQSAMDFSWDTISNPMQIVFASIILILVITILIASGVIAPPTAGTSIPVGVVLAAFILGIGLDYINNQDTSA